MSALISLCCCDEPDPDPPICCDCIASSYSIALSLSWSQDTYDASGNKGSAACAFSYSGKTVIAGNCGSTQTYSKVSFDPSNSIGSITNANISFALTAIDPGFNCSSHSVSNATLNSPMGTTAFLCGQTDFAPAGSLVCYHYTKADGSRAYRWYHQSCFRTQPLDPIAFCYEFVGNINARSPEQSTCHTPPSSGWEIIGGSSPSGLTSSRIEYCSGGPCETMSPLHSTASTPSFSLTIT
jgi:hypothetical protein